MPTVLVGRPPAGPGVDAVVTDERLGDLLATRHLLDLGHRRILDVTADAPDTASAGREAGYRQALEEAGIGGAARIVRTGDDVVAAAGSWPGGARATALFGTTTSWPSTRGRGSWRRATRPRRWSTSPACSWAARRWRCWWSGWRAGRSRGTRC